MIVQSTVIIRVRDLNRSIRFYTEVLGLKRVRSADSESDVEAVGVRIGLRTGKPPKRAREPEPAISIGLRVQDMRAARRTLEARGISFRKGPQDRGAILEYFVDPDGTPLYLIELKWTGESL